MHIIEIRPTSRNEWLQTAQQCPHATFFHTPMWAEIFAEYSSGQIQPYAHTLVFPGETKAIVTLCRRKRLGLFIDYISTPAGNYGGWISADALAPEHVHCIVEHLDSYDNIEWRTNPFDDRMQQIDLPSSSDDFTQAVDLRGGFDTVFAKWSRGHVNAVNKARRAGVVVRRATSIEDWRTHFSLYQKLRRRWRSPSSNYQWKLFEIMHEANMETIALWVAELAGKPLSSVVCFYWNHHAVAWHAAAAQEHFNVRSNHYMYYEIMRNAAEQGFSWFDMNPSGGNEGVVDFKAHLGCEQLASSSIAKRSAVLRAMHIIKKLTVR
jgi:hypothetical protein